MDATRWASVGLIILNTVGLAAQSTPDFSGRWLLSVSPDTPERSAQSLNITAADELLVAQTATSITVQHPSNRGSHPKTRTHSLRSQGLVTGSGNRSEEHAFWFGGQLIVGTTSADYDAEGRRRVTESSEMWSLDSAGQLVIEIAEVEPTTGRRTATLRYRRR